MFDNFIITVLAILLEAFPFVLLGALLSGLIEEFVSPEMVAKYIPKGLTGGILLGSLGGLLLPMCECGSVAIVRRLIQKGVPVVSAITYMLAGPIVNPITILSTYVAYSWYPKMVIFRVALGVAVASITGIVMYLYLKDRILKGDKPLRLQFITPLVHRGLLARLNHALTHAMQDFTTVFTLLLFGATVAAFFKSFSPPEVFLFFKSHEWVGIPAFALLAFALSLCSEADAFIASALNGIFTIPAQLGFLVLGPMLDVKLILMYRQFFQQQALFLVCLIPFSLIILACLLLQLLRS
jgi:uncharacterized membrane protein YraQ (UPF0718 family)